MSSKNITYVFSSNKRSGGTNSHLYFILPTDLFVSEVSIDKVVIANEFNNIELTNMNLFSLGGNLISVDPNAQSIDQLVELLNNQLGENGSAALATTTTVNGITSRRLSITSGLTLTVDHSIHYLAQIYGIEEQTQEAGTTVFDIPFDTLLYPQDQNARLTIVADTDTYNFDIPAGTYLSSEISSILQEKIRIIFTDTNVSLTKDKRLQLDIMGAVSFSTLTIKANQTLGFEEDYQVDLPGPDTSVSITSPLVVNIRVDEIFIQSIALTGSQKNKHYIHPNIKNIVYSKPITQSQAIQFNNPIKFHYIDLILLNSAGKVLNLNNIPWSITLTFTYTNTIAI